MHPPSASPVPGPDEDQGSCPARKLSRRDLAYWDTATHDWAVAPGRYRVMVGDSSRSLPLTGTLVVPGRGE